MDATHLIGSLARFPAALSATIAGLSRDAVLARPDESTWSIAEIVAHLADEEVEDFRPRLRATLEDPGRAWAPIDPEGVAAERRYRDQSFAENLVRFARERERSVAWLRGLRDADWSRTHAHPSLGRLSAGDLLASWAAHDELHARQIAKRRYELVQRAAPGFSVRYAGAW